MGHTVLSVAYPLTEVGENAVGGSEQVLALLDRALTEGGHRSLVIAAEGSAVRGTLIPSPAANGNLDQTIREEGQKIHKRLIDETLSRYSVDVVHMHSLDFHCYLPESGTPTLATLHLPPDWYPRRIFRSRRPHFHLNCVSASQERACPKSSLLMPWIPNGVDVDRFDGTATKRAHALALGRICPEKGFHFALEAAKKACVDFVLAGEVFPYAAHQRYYEKEIAPRLDRRRRFVGPVRFDTKKRLLAGAKCLLIPSTVQETSSLVAMEALASGTPVIAYPSGALPEIIEHGRTGYLVSNVRQMAEAIRAVDQLDPEECRKAARRRFTADQMFQRYLQAYRRILAEKTEQYPRARSASATSWLVSW